jgi:peptide/nickel transport system permease protein
MGRSKDQAQNMKLKSTYLALASTLHRNRSLKRYVRLLVVFVIIAVLSPILANNKPLICKYKNTWLFPLFSWKHTVVLSDQSTLHYNMGKDWKLLNTDFALFAPCAWSPHTIDADNAPRKSPFGPQFISSKNGSIAPLPLKFRHWLGTTQNGNDVLSMIIHGTGIAIGIGFFSMLMASLIGISLGACAGYFANNGIKIGVIQAFFLMTGIFMTWFYCCVIRGDKLTEAFNNGGIWLVLRLLFLIYIALKTIGGMVWIGGYIEKKLKFSHKFNFPIDSFVSRCIEILNSIPALLLIIALSAIAKPSYSLLVLIIGFLSWTSIARLTRAEYLKAKNLEYVMGARALGMRNGRIMFRHILPNVIPVLLVQIIFGMGGAALAEASLSFIGIGVPVNSASWGSLLNEGRDHFSSWWLVVFPGACIFFLVLIYNKTATLISASSKK